MDNLKNIGTRQFSNKLKKSKGRKLSSANWLRRQLNDPYVIEAKKLGYRSRSAFKLIEINDKFNLIRKNSIIIDIGAAPGGWSQFAAKIAFLGKVIAIDLKQIDPIENVLAIKGDFLESETNEIIIEYLNDKKADIIMSDMAAPSCGHTQTDHMRIMDLCESAFLFAKSNLALNGSFIAKILKGGTENNLLNSIKKHFKIVKHFKPKSSREESAESYIIATGFHD